MRGQVIAGFPGVGKSTAITALEDRHIKVADSDSSKFDKAAFPDNYIKHIQVLTAAGYVVLCSSHDVVRTALVEAQIPFTLVYPGLAPEIKAEYLKRYENRGSPEAFIQLLDKNWEGWIAQCMQQQGCRHYQLGKKEYLLDAMPLLLNSHRNLIRLMNRGNDEQRR